ncbi:Mrp/NBP35 family ATP-binding protein [Hoeflea sp. YIM 152468]|uniref:Mrp/NBP35 family ATP-binding protein n=1 Tax=Hoeflea sp. YIM 152468 TaxID=3031759 RepID=UPI0023DA4983|nr:Mrp/NBP35 family ATP-binding protein [Hoeflea sp. YIM 152468]MDF1606836.1 Mrp/NBP35 family ATP-binding protein [Hoeflea sp. YIM 152468]
MTIIVDQILEQLKRVKGPDLAGNIVDLGLVSDIVVRNADVSFSITVPAQIAAQLEPLRAAAEKAALAVAGVDKALVLLTSDRGGQAASPAAAPIRAAPSSAQADALPPPMQRRVTPPSPAPSTKAPVPGIGAIIAVASGKGGVGKSTTSVNIALALQATGLKVGILDADIYGPSMPRLLGLSGRTQSDADRILIPLTGYGLKVMSMGFIVDEDAATAWRGPMVMQALTQMLREVAWGDLDVLIVDMPPGTGDAQLTMAQTVPLAGAVIVSTPQDLALIDARKGLKMFRKVDVPILGIIENMSYFLCPDCGDKQDIFGHGGARAEAERIGVPFLGEVPLVMAIRQLSDSGTPVVASDPDGVQSLIYRDIAGRLWARLAEERMMAGGQG